MRRRTLITCLLAVAASAVVTAPAGAAVPQAKLVNNRRAVAPPSAPPAVKAMIEAANRLRNRPYKWGGGHRSFKSYGYDCSGAVSYVLHAAGMLDYPLVSGQLASWGGAGPGSWVQIYANKDHVFMVIAGLRFDTSRITDGDRTGPGWSEMMRPAKGFRIRHPFGLLAARPG